MWPALITIITWNTLPLVTLTFIASLQSLPSELVDAAEVDGATRPQVVRYIYLPHLKPAIVVMGLMSTFWTFNNFIYVWLTTGAGPGLFTDVLATEVYIKAFIDQPQIDRPNTTMIAAITADCRAVPVGRRGARVRGGLLMAVIATSGPARVARRRAARTLFGEYALLGLTLAVIFVLLYPTAWIFIASFRTPETMFAVRGWVFTIDNYVHLLGSGFAHESSTASSFAPAVSCSRLSLRSSQPMSFRGCAFTASARSSLR